MQEKRTIFPRFYFIGDDDLLEILGQATNPTVIQSHLKKLFAGIHSVQFGSEETEIVAMKSLEGEVVPLRRAVPISPEVEVIAWGKFYRCELPGLSNHKTVSLGGVWNFF